MLIFIVFFPGFQGRLARGLMAGAETGQAYLVLA
jgi:hypothetical protein